MDPGNITTELTRLKRQLNSKSQKINKSLRQLKSSSFNPTGKVRASLYNNTLAFKTNLRDYDLYVRSLPESVLKKEHSIYLNTFKRANQAFNRNNSSFLSLYSTRKLAQAPAVPTNANNARARAARAARENQNRTAKLSRSLAELRKQQFEPNSDMRFGEFKELMLLEYKELKQKIKSFAMFRKERKVNKQ